jgi:hypothetical protein
MYPGELASHVSGFRGTGTNKLVPFCCIVGQFVGLPKS